MRSAYLRGLDDRIACAITEDPLFTLSEMQRADEILREVYRKAGVPERYTCSFHPGTHKFDQTMQEEAFAWFDPWLKPG